jgi:hypothetical protein
MAFFYFMERLHSRQPAAMGIVGWVLQRVGGSAVFSVIPFFYFFIFFFFNT